MEKQRLLAVVGPTASGKTSLAVSLAGRYSGEIVSCDSMQIYRGMPIGTAQPTAEEQKRVKHHLVGFLEPGEDFSVSDYVTAASGIIDNLSSQGILPVLCGGTGLYARSLIYGADFSAESRDEELREKLQLEFQENGIECLYERLQALDAAAAEKIHINNHKRVLRALEYCIATGKRFSEQDSGKGSDSPRYDFLMLGINYRDRETLYSRINLRVDEMLKEGLIDEAHEFYLQGLKGTASQAIGYKELFPYFEGKLSLEEAVENIKLGTRHYAKRQLTWFRREKNITWVYPDDFADSKAFLEHCFMLTDSSGLFGK